MLFSFGIVITNRHSVTEDISSQFSSSFSIYICTYTHAHVGIVYAVYLTGWQQNITEGWVVVWAGLCTDEVGKREQAQGIAAVKMQLLRRKKGVWGAHISYFRLKS